MQRVIVRRIGVTSLYMRIPYEWARAINLTHNDLGLSGAGRGQTGQIRGHARKGPRAAGIDAAGISAARTSAASGRMKMGLASVCPRCGYRLGNFGINARCFNCDYAERGSDGPWPAGVTDQGSIWKAEGIWDGGIPFADDEAFKITSVINYLKQRCVFGLASTCDQLRGHTGLNRIIKIRSGSILLGRVWHVRKGFIGVHATLVEWVGPAYGKNGERLGYSSYERDERRTVGGCQGGAVWFGTVTPDDELVVGEGIETTLSAMILWSAKAGAATLGTAGLRSLVLPQAARKVVIAADNDAPVFKDRKKLPNGMDAAKAARRLWLAEDPSIDVEIKLAPPPKAGEHKRDWNDVLMESEYV